MEPAGGLVRSGPLCRGAPRRGPALWRIRGSRPTPVPACVLVSIYVCLCVSMLPPLRFLRACAPVSLCTNNISVSLRLSGLRAEQRLNLCRFPCRHICLGANLQVLPCLWIFCAFVGLCVYPCVCVILCGGTGLCVPLSLCGWNLFLLMRVFVSPLCICVYF